MDRVKQYIENHHDVFTSELIDLLRFPSISTSPAHQPDITRCSEHLVNALNNLGLTARTYATALHPIVYGEWLHDPDRPTVLIYGHYDVQPPDPLEQWLSPPFEPTIRDGFIYARGASDDKGQFFCHLKSLEAFLKTESRLPVNVKIVLEGEEEIGSPHLALFITEHQDLLRADVALVSDTAMFDATTPAICFSLRGLTYLEITVTGASTDLHSGTYGGVAPNPINVLATILAQLKDASGKVVIPGFYDDIPPLDSALREQVKNLPFDAAQFMRSSGIGALHGEEEYAPLERIWFRPTLDCHGITGGFTEPGAKTIIPSFARAKVSMRLVPNQNPPQIIDATRQYIAALTPSGITVEIHEHSSGSPLMVDTNQPAMHAARHALTEAFGKAPVLIGEGGSIPVVADFKKILGIDTILMGLGLPDDNLHAPNERLRLTNFHRGIHASAHFLHAFGQKKQH